MRRVLAFFGAFNPPTAAHVGLARFAMLQTGREGVVFVPSKSAYIEGEQGKDFAYGDGERLEMLRAAAASRPWMAVEDWEMRRPSQPRTFETLTHLRDSGLEPTLLLGSDKLPELEHIWLHVEDIATRFGFVCLSRGGDACRRMIDQDPYLRALAPYIRVVETPPEFRDVSSSAVRRRIAEARRLREEIAELVPQEILPLL